MFVFFYSLCRASLTDCCLCIYVFNRHEMSTSRLMVEEPNNCHQEKKYASSAVLVRCKSIQLAVSNYRLHMSDAGMCGHSNTQFPFCSFCTDRSLPVAYFLRSSPTSVPSTKRYKAAACEPYKAFCPFFLSPNSSWRWRTMACEFPGQRRGALALG